MERHHVTNERKGEIKEHLPSPGASDSCLCWKMAQILKWNSASSLRNNGSSQVKNVHRESFVSHTNAVSHTALAESGRAHTPILGELCRSLSFLPFAGGGDAHMHTHNHANASRLICLSILLPEKEAERADGELGTLDRLSPRATHNCCQVGTASHQCFHRSGLLLLQLLRPYCFSAVKWPFGVTTPPPAPFEMLPRCDFVRSVWTYGRARPCKQTTCPRPRSTRTNDSMAQRSRWPCGLCFSSSCKELLWGESGLVLPVAGLVHVSAHPARSHRGHSLPLWPGLLQQLASHVSVRLYDPLVCVSRLGAGRALKPLPCYRKEVCHADTVMCPLCDGRCKVWQLSDTCTYAKVHARPPSYSHIFLLVCPYLSLFVPAGEPAVR